MKTLMILLMAAALAACAKPAAAPSKASAQKLQGQVLETLNSGGFTYVRLKTGAGETWMVTSPVDVKVGSEVSVSSAMTVEKFESKSLHRTFDNIVFGSIDGAAPTAHASAPSPMKDVGDVKVDKAEGSDAKTIAEIWASKGALKDRRVVVRGKVVKFLPSIMGKNWMHVRDGSGTRGKGDDDIAVISDDQATVGSVVTLTGTVRLDKDFGAGYQYPVIIDGAKLK
ncbi:MAG TPA: nucleotide-binding protein [Thermoanaerobaculia bacterium]|nr:nucleotide-binding protein [Thermoanaerobaculia bacterium]